MAIRYTVTTYSCSGCGHKIKSDAWAMPVWLLLIAGTAFMGLAWLIAIAALKAIFKVEVVKIGSPFIICKGCNKPILTNEKAEWGDLKDEYKKSWSFRGLLRLSYALGGFVLLLLIIPLIGGFWWSPHDIDNTIALVFLIIGLVFAAGIGVIGYFWKRYKESPYITVTQGDYETIKQSNARRTKQNGGEKYEESPPVKIFGTERIIGNKVAAPQKTKPQQNSYSAPQTTMASEVKQTKEQRWAAQAKRDKEILDRGDEISNQILTAASSIKALWDANAYLGKDNSNSLSYAKQYLRALTADLFLQNYFLFKAGNRDDIKDSIYMERPYIVLDALINMGLYIFQTNNNIEILSFIINSTDTEFASSKGKAQQILRQEE